MNDFSFKLINRISFLFNHRNERFSFKQINANCSDEWVLDAVRVICSMVHCCGLKLNDAPYMCLEENTSMSAIKVVALTLKVCADFGLCVLHVCDIDTHTHMLDEWSLMSNFAMAAGTHELPASLFQWLESNLFQLHSCSTLLTNVGIVEGEQLEHAYAQWFVDVVLGSCCFGLMGWWSRNNLRVPEASRCGRRERRNSGSVHVVQHLCFFSREALF